MYQKLKGKSHLKNLKENSNAFLNLFTLSNSLTEIAFCRILITFSPMKKIDLKETIDVIHPLNNNTHPILHFVANYTQRDDLNPCLNNPCGPNSQCRVIGNQGACSCLPNYVGRPPNCRPECTSNAECASNKACINDRCIDPCIGKCGENAVCHVVKHNAECNCISGYEGDAFTRCTVIVVPCKNRNM